MPKETITKISKEARMKEDCVQYTKDVSLLQTLRRLTLPEKTKHALDGVLDTLLRVLMSLQRKIQEHDTSCWPDMSIARHQIRSRVKRIEQQVLFVCQQSDVKSQKVPVPVPPVDLAEVRSSAK